MAANSEFPNRKIFPELDYITVYDLKKIYSNVIIVDVRSPYEYQTIHIKNALNISRGKPNFVENMRALRQQNVNKQIVLYCNGRTCEQSYLAGLKCKEHHIENILVYDGGVFEFAKNNPDLAVLVGKPMDSADKLISKEKFQDHVISATRFSEMLHADNTVTIDIRDRLQRQGVSLFIGKEMALPINDHLTLENMLKRAAGENKTLLIYDDAGKQVRWLQYYLEDNNISAYYFMEGGANNYLKNLKAER
ncbi:MAG: rhodanese-like domain-containing protein [Gammaproteobacteria bacterium]|nr:rhodanese-like domain-containing protein [Gammaproteobacteria bacterium]